MQTRLVTCYALAIKSNWIKMPAHFPLALASTFSVHAIQTFICIIYIYSLYEFYVSTSCLCEGTFRSPRYFVVDTKLAAAMTPTDHVCGDFFPLSHRLSISDSRANGRWYFVCISGFTIAGHNVARTIACDNYFGEKRENVKQMNGVSYLCHSHCH